MLLSYYTNDKDFLAYLLKGSRYYLGYLEILCSNLDEKSFVQSEIIIRCPLSFKTPIDSS
jgi:hypothetical protein